MFLPNWLTHWRQRRVRAYLHQHHDLALLALRGDPDLATAAVLAAQLQGAGEPQRHSTQYPILNQLGQGARITIALTLPKVTPFNLRRFSEYPPARRAINAIKEPILQQGWCIAPVANPDQSRHVKTTPTPLQHQRITALTSVLTRPNADEGWRLWLAQILEDMLVGGYGASEVAQARDPERPVWLWAVDGQSVRINAHWTSSNPTDFRYAQSLGFAGLSVGTHEVAQLRDDELLYFRLNPRSNTPFGLGYLETAFLAINAFIGAFEYAERRASNATPMFALFLGENVTLDQARRWQQYWEQQIEGYGKIPILGGGRAPQVLPFVSQGEDQLWLKWQEFTLRIIAMSFGLSNTTLNLERDVNRSTAETMDAQDWETVSPVADAFADHLTAKLLWQILGWTDLHFRWLTRDTDERRQAEILREQWESDSITVNEQRQTWERVPLPGPLGDLTKTAYEEAIKAAAQAHSLPAPLGSAPGQEDEDDASGPRRDDALVEAAWQVLHQAIAGARNGASAHV